jgi:hypothetical protein
VNWAVICILGSVAAACATEYELDGRVDQTLFKQDGTVQLVSESRFTVFVKDRVWLVRTTRCDPSGEPLAVCETGCTNGTEVYEVQGSVHLADAATRGQGSRSWNVASIVSNNVPVGTTDGYVICHLWLMFASGSYFADLRTNWLTPVYDVNASVAVNPKLKQEAKWELIGGPGSLPTSVTFLDAYGRTNATYVATGVTNTGSALVPTGFIFEHRIGANRFAPGPLGATEATASYHFRKRAVATVTAVRPYCSRADLLPATKGLTMVIDRRVTNSVPPGGSLPMYVVRTGAQWVPVPAAKSMYVASAAPPKRPRKVAVLLCASVLVVSALILFRLLRKGTNL